MKYTLKSFNVPMQTGVTQERWDSIFGKKKGKKGKKETSPSLTPEQRLSAIADIIEAVDTRASAVDGPVTPTDQEITLKEIQEVYRLAKGG